MNSGIYWLASYPKSGNTWMRVFLTNYWRNESAPTDINDLEATPIASARAIFDTETGVDSGDLTFDEVDRLRPKVYRRFARTAQGEARFCKVHDAYTFLPDGQPLFPPDITLGAIYILRNPLDVAVSYAHHNAVTIDRAINMMNDSDHCLCAQPGVMANQLRQRLLTWSAHVESWLDHTSGFPLLVVRYEDMVYSPVRTFTEVVRFIGGELDATRIQKAIDFSSFEVLQGQEREHGFQEKMQRAESFFRKGKVGDWRDCLTPQQAAQIITTHENVMRRFGYLDEGGCPVY